MYQPANTFCARHEDCGTTLASSTGLTLTAGGSTNTKGSWVTMKSATAFAYEGFTVYCSNGSADDFMVDIGIDDGSGNVSILVPDLHFAAVKHQREHNLALNIPVHVAAGSKLVARCAGAGTSTFFDCLIVGHSANPGGFPGYSRAVALFSPSSSRGVAVDPGGSANTKGSWAEITASTPADVAAIFGVVGFNGDVGRASTADFLLDVGLGAGGSEFVLLPDLYFNWSATWDGPQDVFFQPVAVHIPSGTRLAARGACSITTAGDRTVDLALYGLVP